MSPPYLRTIFIMATAIFFSGCSVPFWQPKPAGIQVNADPQSSVYIDDKHVGETNYFNDKLKPGEYVVKIQPLQNQQQSWETRVRVRPGLTSVVSASFGSAQPELSSYTLNLEKIGNNKVAELNIVTTPENAIVRIDDQPKGFSPLTNISLPPGDHKVTLSSPGYKTNNIPTVMMTGHRLTLTAVLGKSLGLQPAQTATPSAEIAPSPTPRPSATPKPSVTPKPTPSAKPSPSPMPTPSPKLQAIEPDKPYVEILTTPTGWLRVRSEPNGLIENEVTRVNSGEKFKFIESNQTGWFKIEYEPGKQGWIAAQFARLVK